MAGETNAATTARRKEAGRKAADTKARMKREQIAASKDRHPSAVPGLRPFEPGERTGDSGR